MSITTARKLGSELVAGDLINVGIKTRVGKIAGFEEHPQFSQRNSGTARIAVTDRGRITVPDQHLIALY